MRSVPLRVADLAFAATVFCIVVMRARRYGKRNHSALAAGAVTRQVVWRRMALAGGVLLALTSAYLLLTGWNLQDVGIRWPTYGQAVLGGVTLLLCVVGRGARQARQGGGSGRQIDWNSAVDGRAVAAHLAPRSTVEWAEWFGVCLVTSTAEELFFRGFLFNAIGDFAPTWVAVAASSILFGLAHAQYLFRQRMGHTIVGAALAGLYHLGGGLLFAIAGHVLLNLAVVAHMRRVRQRSSPAGT